MKVLQLMVFDPDELAKYNSDEIKTFANSQYMGYDILRDKIDIQWCNPSLDNWFTRKVDKILGAIVTGFQLGQFSIVKKANKYDVVYFPLDAHIIILAVLRRLRICRTPIVMICHSSYNMNYIASTKKRILKRIERAIIFHMLDKIVFASPYLLENAKKDFKIPKRHQNYIYWGGHYEFNNVEHLNIDRSKCEYYLTIGQAKRDYATIIKAFSTMPNVKLKIIYGGDDLLDGTDFTEMPKNIEKIDNPYDKNRWIRMREIYRNAKAAVIPISQSSDVPSGATFLVAAMASGLPTVTTDVGNNFIDVEEENIGLKVGMKDVDGWVKAITRLENNPDFLNTLAKNNTQKAKEVYNYENFTDEVLKILHDISAK